MRESTPESMSSTPSTNHPKTSTKFVGIAGMALLLVALVPLFAISVYNHSYADDWHYGVWAHLALQEGAGPLQLIWVALQQAGKAWVDWQGTYSAIFLMALEPSVWGEQFYVLAAPLVLATLLAGTFFFTHVMLVELMDCPRGLWLAATAIFLVVWIQLVESPVEAIFWYNSSVYYTTYNAAALALLACAGRICNPARTRRPRGVLLAMCLLAAFVAGGNFVTAIVVAQVLVVILAVQIRDKRACSLEMLIGLSVLVLGLVVSFVAPGNEVRQQTQFPEDSAGVWGTIWGSSLAAFQYIHQWSTGLVLLMVLACVPVALYVCPRAVERGFKFRYPAAVVVGSVALFATSFTPTFWAEGDCGPGRVQNCRMFIYYMLLLVDMFWVCGWLEARRQAKRAGSAGMTAMFEALTPEAIAAADTFSTARNTSSVPTSTRHVRPLITLRDACIWMCLAMLVMVCSMGALAANEDTVDNLTSVSATKSLITGQAAEYHEQVLNRLEAIETSSESELKVPFYHDIPHVLWMGDIRDNMDNYINYRLCQWYGKDSIIGYKGSAD